MVTVKKNVLKAVLKVGLKAAVPFVGDILVAAIEEGAGLLIDRQSEKKARDLHGRLLKQMQNHANALARAKRISLERLDYIVPTVEVILSHHNLRQGEWPDVKFDAERATMTVLDRAETTLRSLNKEDKALCGLLIEAFYTALLKDHDALIHLEAAFRSAVLNRLDRLPKVIADYSAAQSEAALRVTVSALIAVPQRPWRPDRSPPGALLRADHEGAVPFHGREKETADIESWCSDDAVVGVRLYTGAGGMGKTRLFIELCKSLEAKGWRAGFLNKQAANAEPELWSEIISQQGPLLVVVDYAETRRKELGYLLREAFKADTGTIRIVLLARAASDWWDIMKTEGDGVGELLSGPATNLHSLRPVAMKTEDRTQSYWKAAATFAQTLKKPRPADIPNDIEADHFERILLLHMSALAAIDGVQVKGEQGLLDYVLKRERRFWSDQAKLRGVPKTTEPGIGQSIAVITLGGGASDENETVLILEKIPLLEGQTPDVLIAIARLLHDTYPGDKWIEPIVPDLLGEHLVQVELERDTDVLFDLVLGARGA